MDNNALSAQDEKQRQDAKWSLPYLEGEKKQQAEKLISDLNAKDKAFDAKLNAACQGLSTAACQGMRLELAAMGQSYDEKKIRLTIWQLSSTVLLCSLITEKDLRLNSNEFFY